jgi:hypothetical protein
MQKGQAILLAALRLLKRSHRFFTESACRGPKFKPIIRYSLFHVRFALQSVFRPEELCPSEPLSTREPSPCARA